jgi:hypothetical protein
VQFARILFAKLTLRREITAMTVMGTTAHKTKSQKTRRANLPWRNVVSSFICVEAQNCEASPT